MKQQSLQRYDVKFDLERIFKVTVEYIKPQVDNVRANDMATTEHL